MRLLLVEDDQRIAADIERALTAAGYVVESARDGEDAWFRGDTEDYGAIILDLGLPGMDGLAVLKRWRAKGASSRTIHRRLSAVRTFVGFLREENPDHPDPTARLELAVEKRRLPKTIARESLQKTLVSLRRTLSRPAGAAARG